MANSERQGEEDGDNGDTLFLVVLAQNPRGEDGLVEMGNGFEFERKRHKRSDRQTDGPWSSRVVEFSVRNGYRLQKWRKKKKETKMSWELQVVWKGCGGSGAAILPR